jgi:hypothetical protein
MNTENKNTEHKALELVSSFITGTIGMPTLSNKQAKQCALIAVDLVLGTLSPYLGDSNAVRYWQEVKQKIKQQ